MKTGDFVVYIVTLMALKAADSEAKHKTARLLRRRFFFSSSFLHLLLHLNKSLSFMAIMSRRRIKLLSGERIEIH